MMILLQLMLKYHCFHSNGSVGYIYKYDYVLYTQM